MTSGNSNMDLDCSQNWICNYHSACEKAGGAADLPTVSKFYRNRTDAMTIFHARITLSKEDTCEAWYWTNSTSEGLRDLFRQLV